MKKKMMTRKAVLVGVGLWVAGTGLASASGRTRTADDPGSDRVAAAEAEVTSPAEDAADDAVEVREIRPDVFEITTRSGDKYVVNGDGTIRLSEIEASYGTAGRAALEGAHRGDSRQTLADGTVVFEDGTIGYYGDLVGAETVAAVEGSVSEPEPLTTEALKQIKPWTELTIEGYSILQFDDGTITAEMASQALPPWVGYRQQMTHAVAGERTFYADGTVFLNEPREPADR